MSRSRDPRMPASGRRERFSGPWIPAAACGVALLAACGGAPAGDPVAEAASAATTIAASLPRHELIFARHADAARQDYDLWRVCADGTQLASLVVEPGHQFQLAVSPDGKDLFYASKVDDAWDVFRRPFGRGETVNLTRHPANDGSPSISPGGKRLAFTSDRDGGKPELYLLDLESGEPRRITENEVHDSGAAWSPDGSTVALTRFFPEDQEAGTESSGEIIAIDLATGAETRLTELGGYNGGLAFSPDGATIAFHHTGENGSDLWLIDADGSNPRPLTSDTIRAEYSPEWSPDGEWIAYTAGVGHDGLGTFDLWLMRPDGGDARVLLAGPNTEAWHKWRPGEHLCR